MKVAKFNMLPLKLKTYLRKNLKTMLSECLVQRVGEQQLTGVRSFPAFKDNADAQKDYDRSLALKIDSLIGFVKETQPKEWAKIERMYGVQY